MEVQEDLGREWPNIPHVHQPRRGEAEGEESGDKAPEPARVARGGAAADAGEPGVGGGVEAAPAAAEVHAFRCERAARRSAASSCRLLDRSTVAALASASRFGRTARWRS